MFFEILKRYRTSWMLLVYVLVAFGLLLVERRHDEPGVGVLGGLAVQATASAQDLTDYGTAGLGDAWDRYVDLVRVNQENERLRAELDRLREEHTRLLGVMQQNARLRAMVGFTDAWPTLELVPARVIARDVTSWFRVSNLRLDVDAARVQPGMPVVSSAGVVGYVASVEGRYAQVVLAVDPRSSIDVLVQRNRSRGVLEGLGTRNAYDARIAYLLRRDVVEVGDIVVTSGMGGRFPSDLVVGRISAVVSRDFGLFQEVVVEPAVDFSRLEEVFVVVGEDR